MWLERLGMTAMRPVGKAQTLLWAAEARADGDEALAKRLERKAAHLPDEAQTKEVNNS